MWKQQINAASELPKPIICFSKVTPFFSLSILPLLGFISSLDRGTRMGEEWFRML